MAVSRILVALCGLLFVASSAQAFDHFADGFGSKWGPDPNAGTPAVVTWGFMPDGTTVDPTFELDPWNHPGETGFSGNSNISSLRQRIDVTLGHGAGAFDAALMRAMETWSKVANITFVGPVEDPGLPFPSSGATTPDIRIGAFMPAVGHSFNFAGAVGFGPPGFGPDPLAGDIIFNLGATIDIVTGVEDVTPIPTFPLFVNDLEGLFLHELGHAALGLGHPPWEGEDPDQRVMYVGEFGNPNAPPGFETINRQLHEDDIAGAQFVYGARGDFNGDNLVDAADYTVWRDNLGTLYDAADYLAWRDNFGRVRPTVDEVLFMPGALTVPEPSGWLVLAIAMVGGLSAGLVRN